MIAFARAVSVEARKLLSSRALPALAACAGMLAGGVAAASAASSLKEV